MGCTKAELQERMTYAEFVEHKVDYELLPWGDDWVQIDLLLHAILKTTKGDFIPRGRIAVMPQTPEELAAKLDAMFGITPEMKGEA